MPPEAVALCASPVTSLPPKANVLNARLAKFPRTLEPTDVTHVAADANRMPQRVDATSADRVGSRPTMVSVRDAQLTKLAPTLVPVNATSVDLAQRPTALELVVYFALLDSTPTENMAACHAPPDHMPLETETQNAICVYQVTKRCQIEPVALNVGLASIRRMVLSA